MSSSSGPYHDSGLLDGRERRLICSRQTAQVMVVILNFNGIEDTLACLNSLRTQTCQDIVVQVIDNGSKAGDLGHIATQFPDVELISLPENLGWAGGNNIGIRKALERGFGHVCLLNSDTLLDPTAIEELLVASALLERRCLLHPAIAYYDDPAKWQLNPQLHPSADAASRDLESNCDLIEMDGAYGACLLIPASVLARVGLLDERFFLQLEETDYFLRAKALNIRSFCARRARILHKESASFGGFLQAARSVIWALRNQAQARGIRIKGWHGFLRWLLSADPFAYAARQGARDYSCRRFGRRPATRAAS